MPGKLCSSTPAQDFESAVALLTFGRGMELLHFAASRRLACLWGRHVGWPSSTQTADPEVQSTWRDSRSTPLLPNRV